MNTRILGFFGLFGLFGALGFVGEPALFSLFGLFALFALFATPCPKADVSPTSEADNEAAIKAVTENPKSTSKVPVTAKTDSKSD